MEQNTAHPKELNDEYTTGVFYDPHSGDFVEFHDSGNDVEFINPKNGKTYYTVSYDEWHDETKHELVEVKELAVEHPEKYYRQTVEALLHAAQYSGRELSYSREISFRYATGRVNVVEKED